MLTLLSIGFALVVALGAAQVSGAKGDSHSYSIGQPPSFDGLDDTAAQDKARDVVKHVQDVRAQVEAAERDGDISGRSASQIRGEINRRVEQAKANFANRKRPSSTKPGNGPGGQGGGTVPTPRTQPGTGSTAKPSPSTPVSPPATTNGGANKPKRTAPQQQSPAPRQRSDAPAPNSPAPQSPAPQTGGDVQAKAVGVAGAYASSVPADGSSDRGGSTISDRDRLQALIDGTAKNDVGIDIADNRSVRRLLSQATTGVPLGYQALLMGLLFVVALLLVLVLRERRRAQHVERVSQLDYLTGLANREGFDRMLAIEWRRAMRYGHTLGIVFIDLDDFKRFNDSNGHLAGDRLLREVAAVINSEARASDYTARLGGDEFVILCPETDAAGLEALARRLETASVGLAVSLSIGFTHQLPTDTSAEDLVGRADAAMYQAKAERGSFVVSATKPKTRS
jgi:diguanylate cyclase (GGDEF)-like protein